MAYSELDRNYVRHYVGYGAIWLQAEPRLENAIQATQSVADGGGRPDSSTENQIKAWIYGASAVTGATVVPGGVTQNLTFSQPALMGLLSLESLIQTPWQISYVLEADNEGKVDPARGVALLRREGRRLCHGMARLLGMRGVRADVFSASPVVKDDDPFSYSDMHHWRGGP